MKKIIITVCAFFSIASIILLSCSKNKDNKNIGSINKGNSARISNTFQTNISNATFIYYATLGHTENISNHDKSSLDSFYFSLNPLELKLFLIESGNYLKLQLDSEDSSDIELDSATVIAQIESMIDISYSTFNKGFNKLNDNEKIEFDNALKLGKKKVRGSCPIVTYTNSCCNTNSFTQNCQGWQRASTPDDPNDCDYDFFFMGNNQFNHGTTWFAQGVLTYWGSCGIKSRFLNSQRMTILVGNGAINAYYWGWASIFKKRCKMR